LRDLLPEDVRVIEKADVLLTQLEVPLEAVAAAISIAAKGGARVLLTPVPVRPLPKHVLDGVDILALSESEARQLTGAKGLNETVLALLETVPEVVVTRGAEGCLYANRQGERLMAPAPRAVALDTTGAGDTLIGVLSTFMSTGTDMRDALRWAVTAASLSVQLKGASSSVPSQDHIQRVLVETPEVTRLVAARVLKREIRHG
jgi:ribokinase